VRGETAPKQWVRTRTAPLAMGHRTAMPAHALELKPLLTHVALTRLVPAPHTLPPFDRATGSHRVGDHGPHTGSGLGPLRAQTLAHNQGCDDHRGGVRLTGARCAAPRCAPIPSTGDGFAPQRVWHGLRQLPLPPVPGMQRPRVLEPPPPLPPCLATHLAAGVAQRLLRPGALLQRPIGAPHGPRRLEAVHRRCGCSSLVKDARGRTPCLAGASRGPAGSDAARCGLGDRRIGG